MIDKRRVFVRAGFALLLMLALGELTARYGFGLGTPPLSITHEEIEYMFKPSQDVYRFGNRILINEYGMRAGSLPVLLDDSIRVLVFGDSVINGGSLTDHGNLATTLLQESLNAESPAPTWVGNASAGSWGVSNVYAYFRQYGLFAANYVIFVFNSADTSDCPTFAPLNRHTHPSRQPVSALLEGLDKYLPRYLPIPGLKQSPVTLTLAEEEACTRQSVSDLNALLAAAKVSQAEVVVLHHPTLTELQSGRYETGFDILKETAAKHAVTFMEMAPYFLDTNIQPKSYYRDRIHINERGQKTYFRVLRQLLN